MTALPRRALLTSATALALAPIAGAVLLPRRADAMPSGGPLRIGVLADLTGPLAAHADHQLKGVRHRAESVAGGHGHAGEEIALLVADTAADPDTARSAAFQLLEQGVHAMIGTSAGWTTEAVLEAAEVGCTPLITPGGQASELPSYAFQSGPAESAVTRRMMQAAKESGAQKVALLSLEQLDTDAAKQLAQQQAAAQGLELADPQRFGMDATDLTGPVEAALAGQPDALVVNALPPYDAMVVRAARAAGWQGALLLPPSAARPGFHAEAGPDAEGATLVAPWLAAADQAPTELSNRPTMQRFSESFSAAHGTPGSHAGYGSDAVSLLHLAFLGHRDRKAAREALEQMCCVGVSGVFNMTKSNHAGLDHSALATLTSQGGRWVGAGEI